MHMIIYLDRHINEYPFVSPLGIDQIADTLLWLHFAGDPVTTEQIDKLSHAIPGLKGVYWHREFISPDNLASAFQFISPDRMEPSSTQLINTTIQFNNTHVKSIFNRKFTRTSVHWIDEEQIVKVADKAGSSMFGEAIALIPFNDEAAWQWHSITYGLAWHSQWWMARPKTNLNEWIFLVDEVLQNYLKLTDYIGGIPSLPFKDINAQIGWLFVGKFEPLRQIYEALKEVASIYSEEEFRYYYNRYEPGLTHDRYNV
jgi:hypothetical protein